MVSGCMILDMDTEFYKIKLLDIDTLETGKPIGNMDLAGNNSL